VKGSNTMFGLSPTILNFTKIKKEWYLNL